MSNIHAVPHRETMKQSETYFAFSALAGRLLLSPIFILSGFGKITGSETYLGYIAAFGLPFPVICLVGAIALELLGGLALALGYHTRIVGLALALFSLFTALVFHSDFSDQNQFLHFWKNAAMAGGLLEITAFGAGVFSLDGMRHRRRMMM
ncbi:DoxX family protein [Agrobacterium tumefaciens]|uniref:DoxX family protein n=1 Tax=Agrobacterium tumefaciens TaxID=358 RepID=UPI00287E6E0D|nr:DoxX family protein [Agrobacterium tumefaciens]MDS7598480.1 DoxX family protein [Agrobacterium tumefaciens]